MTKRTKQFHGSWFKFRYEDQPLLCPEQIEAALDKFCRGAFYMKPSQKFFMIQKKDASRLRLRGFLDLKPPEHGYNTWRTVNGVPTATPVLDQEYPNRIYLQMNEKNTKASEIAKDMRKRLPEFKIRSENNNCWKPNGQVLNEQYRGRIDVMINQPSDRDAVLDTVTDLLKNGTFQEISTASDIVTFFIF